MNGEQRNGHRLRRLDQILPMEQATDRTVRRMQAAFASLAAHDQCAIRKMARHKRREDARRDPNAPKSEPFDLAAMSQFSNAQHREMAHESADAARRWAFAHDDIVCEVCTQ